MNLEKTVQFILDQQARTEANLAVVFENQAKTEVALKELIKQQAKADRKVSAIAVLVTAGMKRLIRIEKTFNARMNTFEAGMNTFAAGQQRTDQKLDRLLALLTRQRSNGHQR